MHKLKDVKGIFDEVAAGYVCNAFMQSPQNMRYLFLLLMLFFYAGTFAQQVNGLIIDLQSRQAIANALITSSKTTTVSDLQGRFTIGIRDLNDTIRVSASGFALRQITGLNAGNTLIIELSKQVIELNQVTITAKRDRIKDSLNNRAMFAKSFNSAAPKLKDIVKVSVANGPLPVAGVTIVPSQLLRAIAYKGSREYKFKQVLLRDEGDKYIDSRFSKTLVTSLTKLQNDSLTAFMQAYRPTIEQVKKMTEYDMMVYIKKSLVTYKSQAPIN